MGWIFQYALVDREGTRDLRELRLLNESQIKPALQSAAGVAEVASVGGLEKQYQVKLFPPLLSERGILAAAGHRRRPGRVPGSRRPDDRGHQPRVSAARRASTPTTSTSSSSWSSAATRTGSRCSCKDVGYLQVGYDLRRGIADLDGDRRGRRRHRDHGAGPQRPRRHRALQREARASSGRRCPQGIEIVTTYDRSSLIWDTLDELLPGHRLRADRRDPRHRASRCRTCAPRSRRSASCCSARCSPRCRSSAFGQTINLFSLAGLAIAIGEMADATIVIVENCTAELAQRGAT